MSPALSWPRRHLASAGFSPRTFLGMGYDGAVFAHGEGRVVKYTNCAGEAAFFLWLMEIGGHPGFPTAWRVCQSGRWRGERGYCVLREALPDIEVTDLGWLELGAESLSGGSGFMAEHARSRMTPETSTLLDGLAEAFAWAREAGCDMSTSYDGNLGIRDGVAVIRDLSRCTPPEIFYRTLRIPTA